jgi:hypothetical protein
MQDLFSKVNTEKRHLYGSNGILGHRRAISTTIPSKNPSISGHRRTYSNTSSDFKAIFCTSPALLKQIEQISVSTPPPPPSKFLSFLNLAFSYFSTQKLPPKFSTRAHKLQTQVKEISDLIRTLQKEQITLIHQKTELKSKVKYEIEAKKSAEVFLQRSVQKTNEMEIALKNTQEEIRCGKIRIGEMVKKIEEGRERNIFASLQIETNEEFGLQKNVPKSLYGVKSPVFPLTPSAKIVQNSSGNTSPI